MIIRNGLIFDAVHPEPYTADIRAEGGKITQIAPELTPLDGEPCVDAAGLRVYPGFVEAHCHLGLDGWGIGFEGHDYNEMGDVCTPHLRAEDSFNPFDPTVRHAARAGVTSVATGQGSANALGGTWIAVKTVGTCVDDMIIRTPVAMKGALGENPKRCYREKGNSARMSTASVIRGMLFTAREYLAKKEAAGDDLFKKPPFDFKCETMIPVLKKEIPLKLHGTEEVEKSPPQTEAQRRKTQSARRECAVQTAQLGQQGRTAFIGTGKNASGFESGQCGRAASNQQFVDHVQLLSG